MQLKDLLNKYFEGETSAAEEKQLRDFFASSEIPPEWAEYKPLFAYFDEEIEKEQQKVHESFKKKKISLSRQTFYIISGIAASMLILFGINYRTNPTSAHFCAKNYVIINGKCYTDIHKVREMAFDALQEVASGTEEYLPAMDDDFFGQEIIENQLKELGTLFSDDN